jgi:hypothetical protein
MHQRFDHVDQVIDFLLHLSRSAVESKHYGGLHHKGDAGQHHGGRNYQSKESVRHASERA